MSTRTVHPSAPQTRRGLGLVGACLTGMLLAAQSRVNGTLGARLGDGLTAATISFGLGFVVLVLCSAFIPAARRGLRDLWIQLRGTSGLRFWQCLGGLSGAYLVFSQGVAADVLGVALFTVAVVAGQVVSGLVVDRYGLGPAGRQKVTGSRVLGAALAVVAVVIAVSAQLGGSHASWQILLPAVAGVSTAWQQAVNGRVKEVTNSAVGAATINFGVGTVALLAACAVEFAVVPAPTGFPAEPWLYIGGLLGIFVIGGGALLVRHTGVLLLSMGMVAGQLLGALLLDLLLPAPGTTVAVSTLVGIALTLVAVLVAALPARGGQPRST